jgi:hypothetical protein
LERLGLGLFVEHDPDPDLSVHPFGRLGRRID